MSQQNPILALDRPILVLSLFLLNRISVQLHLSLMNQRISFKRLVRGLRLQSEQTAFFLSQDHLLRIDIPQQILILRLHLRPQRIQHLLQLLCLQLSPISDISLRLIFQIHLLSKTMLSSQHSERNHHVSPFVFLSPHAPSFMHPGIYSFVPLNQRFDQGQSYFTGLIPLEFQTSQGLVRFEPDVDIFDPLLTQLIPSQVDRDQGDVPSDQVTDVDRRVRTDFIVSQVQLPDGGLRDEHVA